MRHEPIESANTVLNFELNAAIANPEAERLITNDLQVPVTGRGACGLIGASAIETGNHYFTPIEEGRVAAVMPVFYGSALSANLIDLAAWYPDSPEQWWLRTGVAWGLGEHHADPPFWNDPVKIFRTPMSWLAGSGQGVCLLDRENAWDHIGGIPKPAAEDESHGRELEALLRPPAIPKPKIVIPKEQPRV